MRRTLGLVLVVALTLAAAGAAQSNPARAWSPDTTPDGQPDLQGMRTNPTITPFERPASLRDNEFLTEAEARALERQAASRRDEDGPPRKGDVGNYNQFWLDTSLVIDSPDGRVPMGARCEEKQK